MGSWYVCLLNCLLACLTVGLSVGLCVNLLSVIKIFFLFEMLNFILYKDSYIGTSRLCYDDLNWHDDPAA